MNTAFDVPALADEDDLLAWQGQALCAETDPEAFFPERGSSNRDAKRICAGCTVKPECLEYALTQDESFGTWGGLSESERRRIGRTGPLVRRQAPFKVQRQAENTPRISAATRELLILEMLRDAGGKIEGTAAGLGLILNMTSPSRMSRYMHGMVGKGLITWVPRGRWKVTIAITDVGRSRLEAQASAA